eukprot:5788789-Amphidinium_carterae.4
MEMTMGLGTMVGKKRNNQQCSHNKQNPARLKVAGSWEAHAQHSKGCGPQENSLHKQTPRSSTVTFID